MLLKSIMFNVFTIALGAGFLYFGYEAYLISNWPIAFLGIVGGAAIILFSIALIVLKIVTT